MLLATLLLYEFLDGIEGMCNIMLTIMHQFLMTGLLLVSPSTLEYVVNYAYLQLSFIIKAQCSVSCMCCPAL